MFQHGSGSLQQSEDHKGMVYQGWSLRTQVTYTLPWAEFNIFGMNYNAYCLLLARPSCLTSIPNLSNALEAEFCKSPNHVPKSSDEHIQNSGDN